jgi:hypothetical protein
MAEDIYRCRWCDVKDPEVECAGMYECPIPICPSWGAAYHRFKMKTYKRLSNGKHTVDPEEMIEIGEAFLKDEKQPQHRREAAERCLLYWRGQHVPSPQTGMSRRFYDIGMDIVKSGNDRATDRQGRRNERVEAVPDR